MVSHRILCVLLLQVEEVVSENDKLQDKLLQMGDLSASVPMQKTTGSAWALLKEENMLLRQVCSQWNAH